MSRSLRCATRSWRYTARFTAVALFALTTAAHGAAIRHSAHMFGGRTAQSDPLVLSLSHGGRAIDHVVLWVDADCDDGDDITYAADAALHGRVDARGRGSAKGVATRDYGDAVGSVAERVAGHFGKTRASGMLAVTVTLVDKATQQPRTTCRSGPVRWTARDRPGTVFAGATDQSDPVVLELSTDRRRVTAFRVTWQSGCSPAGSYAGSEDLAPGSLRDGVFASSVHAARDYDDGSRTTYDYTLDGAVDGHTAHGSFAASVLSLDPLGPTRWACDSGPITWRAST